MFTKLALTSAFAVGALAGPIVKRQEVVTVTDVTDVVDTVYTTVGAGAPAPSSASAAATTYEAPAAPASSPQEWHWTWAKTWTESSTPASTSAPPPPPTTSSVVEVTSSAAPVTSAPVSTSASSAPLPANSMASAAVVRHNDHRRNHTGTPDVAWDADLAATAQDVANMCNWTHVTTANGGGYGQNYGASPTGSTIQDAIEMWYSETTLFLPSYYGQLDATSRGCDASGNCPEYGHFTQMIWKSSTKIGCAIADCSGGYVGGDDGEAPDGSEDPVFQVCNYSPAGNVNPTLSSDQETEPSMLAWASSVGYPDNLSKPTGLPSI